MNKDEQNLECHREPDLPTPPAAPAGTNAARQRQTEKSLVTSRMFKPSDLIMAEAKDGFEVREPTTIRKFSNTSARSNLIRASSFKYRRERRVPEMYRAALGHNWAYVIWRASTHPEEATYINAVDGSTVLHLAVISRASYSNCFMVSEDLNHQPIRAMWGECKSPAPLGAIHALLKANPNAVKVRCKKVGYTPVAYASLVAPPATESTDDTILGAHSKNTDKIDNRTQRNRTRAPKTQTNDGEPVGYQKTYLDSLVSEKGRRPMSDPDEPERLVRLLVACDTVLPLQPNSGLSPVHVHIISYSQIHGTSRFSTTNIDEAIKTTAILRLLLKAEQARLREHSSNAPFTQRALEFLYERNASAILDAVELASISKARKDALSPSDLNGWWVWHWLLVLLKAGIIRERGSQFSPLHAATLVDGCPLPILMLLMRAFPLQARTPCVMTDTREYALHCVCCWGGRDQKDNDTAIFLRKRMAISAILGEFPAAAAQRVNGRTALCLALECRTAWSGGVQKLHKAYPGAIHIPDPRTGLYPFMTAAAAAPQNSSSIPDMRSLPTRNNIDSHEDLLQLGTVFELLRASPDVLVDCLADNETDEWLAFKRAAEQQSLGHILQHWSENHFAGSEDGQK